MSRPLACGVTLALTLAASTALATPTRWSTARSPDAYRDELARAAAEDLGTPLSRLRVDGGLTRSATLLQVQADLLQAPVEVHPTPHATAEGIAAFATIGVGAALAPEPPAGTRTVFEPRIGAAEADERLARWCAVAEATMDR